VESLRALDTASRAGLRLVDEVLDWSRVARSAPRVEECFELADLQSSAAVLAAPFCEQTGVRCLWRVPRNRQVFGVLSCVRQVLLCFVTNAVKFSRRGDEIEAELWLEEPGGGEECFLHASVRDGGCGFDPRDAERLFEPFVQLQPREGGRGVGLGLAIARDLVRAMNGEIFAHSDGRGRGARFGFVLPVRAKRVTRRRSSSAVRSDAVPLREARARAREERRNDSEGSGGAMVLCVEDSPVLLRVLVKQVTAALGPTAHVVTASSAVAALGLLEEAFARGQPFSAVLTDVMMEGGLDGIELALVVRAKERVHNASRTRIVGVSAMTDDGTLERAKAFDVFIKKPVTIDQIRTALAGMAK
jgi:CheY-like chemotaxis protein